MATLPGRGNYNTIIKGFPMFTILYKVSVTYKIIPTTMACAQNAATVVPFNDTRTQCTTTLLAIDFSNAKQHAHHVSLVVAANMLSGR